MIGDEFQQRSGRFRYPARQRNEQSTAADTAAIELAATCAAEISTRSRSSSSGVSSGSNSPSAIGSTGSVGSSATRHRLGTLSPQPGEITLHHVVAITD